MPMCKGCKETVSALEVKEGLCKSCRENGVPTPKAEEVTTEAEQVEEAKGFFVTVVSGLVALFFLWAIFHGEDKESKPNNNTTFLEEGKTYETKRSTIGCEDMNKLYVAIKAYRHGGLNALMPLVKSAGCLWLPNTKVMLVKKTDFAYEVYFDNPEGRSRYLWVDERELK